MVLWEVCPGRVIWLMDTEAQDMMAIIEAYDAVPFVWQVSGGYIFALMPRSLWATVS